MGFSPLILSSTKAIRISTHTQTHTHPCSSENGLCTSLESILVLITLHGDMHMPCMPPSQAELPETCKNWGIRLHITKIISRYCWKSAGILVGFAVWRLKICQVKLINHLLIAARSIMSHCWEKNRAHQREHQLWKNLKCFLNGEIDRTLER